MKASDWQPSYCLLESWRGSQSTGINSPNYTRFLLDQAILVLENMPVQDEAIRKARVALENLFVLPGGEKGKR
jgi:hypothetical protein